MVVIDEWPMCFCNSCIGTPLLAARVPKVLRRSWKQPCGQFSACIDPWLLNCLLVPPNGPFAGDVLPYHPIWPGFAVNTAFYATVLWLLICVSLALRRFIRMKRGLCPKCTYPMGESPVCTECGKALPRRMAVTS